MCSGASVGVDGRCSCWSRRPPDTPPAWAPTLAASAGLAVAGAPLADFFEGTGLLYQRDGDGGSWREIAAVTDTHLRRAACRGRWRR